MENGSSNGPLVAMTLIVGLGAIGVTGVLSSILVAVLVGLLGKSVDVALRLLVARRDNHWRREAKRLQRELDQIRNSNAPQNWSKNVEQKAGS
jgi:hypothetical protein